MQDLDYQTQMSIQNLLAENKQLREDIIKYRPEVTVEYDSENKIAIASLKLNGKVSKSQMNLGTIQYYDIKDQASEFASELAYTYELLLRELVMPDLTIINTNINNFGD
jgi:hypothetical protein